jgi:hypothetical protein
MYDIMSTPHHNIDLSIATKHVTSVFINTNTCSKTPSHFSMHQPHLRPKSPSCHHATFTSANITASIHQVHQVNTPPFLL